MFANKKNLFLIKIGTHYNGNWDGWYGPTGRPDGTMPPYDIDLVTSSLVATHVAQVGRPVPDYDDVSLKYVL